MDTLFYAGGGDLGIEPARHGFLEHWAEQGVLLLNSVLTVEDGKAASHAGRGWERFTDAIVRKVAELPHPVVFILWGSHAQRKAAFVTDPRHLLLKSVPEMRLGWLEQALAERRMTGAGN